MNLIIFFFGKKSKKVLVLKKIYIHMMNYDVFCDYVNLIQGEYYKLYIYSVFFIVGNQRLIMRRSSLYHPRVPLNFNARIKAHKLIGG